MNPRQRHGPNSLAHRVCIVTRVEYIQAIQIQVFKGRSHRARYLGSDRPFDLESKSLHAPHDEEIQLGP